MLSKDLSHELVVLITTESDQEKAERLANLLLKRKLIACANFVSVNSSYWWDGEIVRSKEVQLILKTKKSLINDLIEKVKDFHSFNTPEIIYWVAKTSKDYMRWLDKTTL